MLWNWDANLFYAVNSLAVRSELISNIAVFCAEYLPYLVGLLYLYFVLTSTLSNKRELVINTLAPAVLTRLLFATLIKQIIARPRPFLALPGVHMLVEATGFSMPSGHASFFFALATSVWLVDKRWGYIFFALAIVISMARVAVGIHYPSDILTGLILGGGLAYIMASFRMGSAISKL